MKKKILIAGVCLLSALFCTLGCEKKSEEEKTLDDVTKQVKKTGQELQKEAEETGKEIDKELEDIPK